MTLWPAALSCRLKPQWVIYSFFVMQEITTGACLMSLAEDKLFKQDPIALFDVDEAIRRWETTQPSMISHHGLRCCALAREWIFSTDHAQLNGEHLSTGSRWLRHRFTWGPSPWPIAWCQVVRRKVLDCGAFAALAHEIFSTRG